MIRERGLEPNGDFTRQMFTPEELRQRVLDDFLEDYSREEAKTDVISTAAFGLIEPDFEFYDFYIDLLSEQVAGFYDNETKEMAVIQGEGWGGPERMTYAHEYFHALQDHIPVSRGHADAFKLDISRLVTHFSAAYQARLHLSVADKSGCHDSQLQRRR